MSIALERRTSNYILIFALLGIIFYFLHVVLGTIIYPGYDSLSQPVSDLTGDNSPSKVIARVFSSFYGVFSSLVSIGLIYSFRGEKNKLLRFGVYFLSIMYLVSAIGYAIFPLASSNDITDIQNIMHIVVTGLVVFLTVIALSLLIISFFKSKLRLYFIISLITFLVLMSGALLMNAAPVEYFGLFERFSVYSVVIYLGVISYYNYDYHKKVG
jgi:hypothetical protein